LTHLSALPNYETIASTVRAEPEMQREREMIAQCTREGSPKPAYGSPSKALPLAADPGGALRRAAAWATCRPPRGGSPPGNSTCQVQRRLRPA